MWLPQVELAINNSVQESTGKAPVELVFGQRVVLPLDVLVGADGANDAAADVAQRVQQLVEQAQQQLEHA